MKQFDTPLQTQDETNIPAAALVFTSHVLFTVRTRPGGQLLFVKRDSIIGKP